MIDFFCLPLIFILDTLKKIDYPIVSKIDKEDIRLSHWQKIYYRIRGLIRYLDGNRGRVVR